MELTKNNIPPPPCPQIRLGKIESTLVRKPTFGIFPWWPDESEATDWIHPDDLEIALQLVPGNHVLCRREPDENEPNDSYLVFEHGNQSFRAQPRMWLEIPEPDYQLLDVVEICSKLGKVHPRIATVSQVCWNRLERIAEYRLLHNEMPIPQVFHAADLQPAVKLGETMSLRQLQRRRTISLVD